MSSVHLISIPEKKELHPSVLKFMFNPVVKTQVSYSIIGLEMEKSTNTVC